ncbi:putative disease resistance RPP13-like protein 1 [Eucalyptus grandis]|uniref:putative disease resistance RPP13-like protein 1 n=1 Tax=Eucalyptus grandis TaxID=71139 RepID=UPI00192E9F61|nr:putative disease resistance RPP13-like protein 1 [Eucalyptus grandis]
MAIGDIFLGSFFQILLDKLASLGLDYAQREGSSTTLLHKWKGMLETIYAVLGDAEDKQLSGDNLVKLWLDDVRDLAYDMEDLLDDFEIKATQAKSETESTTSRGQLKRKFSFFSRPRLLVSKTKLQEISGRFEEIVTAKAPLSLMKNVVDRSHYTNKRLPSTSLPEFQFFGREKEEAQVLELLISDVQNSDATLSIIPIVGMAGVGKTALAQRIYNDARVSSYFERKAWVCVSDVFDVLDITKTILRSITGLPYEDKDLNGLQVKLKDSLSRKKFLVVLDDVWNEKYVEWTSLLKPFEVGVKGSKIIITTRNLPVVSITGALPYPLKELSIDNCIGLLAFHALGARNFERHPNLEIIGNKIAEKCRGLPLAAKMLGGLLRNKENPDEWEAILNNKIWDAMMEKNDEVLPALKLSYVNLPSYLKRCFVYCAVFPKAYEIDRDELALLWIAEGFLDGQKAKENILRLGRNYFDELVSRSFFQQSSVHTSKFLMHDLLNDLAKSIAGATCFTFGESWEVNDEDDASFKKARYASVMSSLHLTSRCLRAYEGMKVLRSLTDCPNVTSLPSLGQLPLLKELYLQGLHAVSVIGSEFCAAKKPFPSLTTLKFEEMLAWKDWSHYAEGQEKEVPFSYLQHLVVRNNPSLVGTLPCQLDHLIKLEIHSCPHMKNSTNVVCLPSLNELYLENCNKEILKSLVKLTSLTILKIGNLIELVCFDHGFMSCLVKLKELHIRRCDKLAYLWQDGNDMQNLTCLKGVIIESCSHFTTFLAGDKETELPCNLERMELRNCISLEKLPSNMHTLRYLGIDNCPKITGQTVPRGDPNSNNPISQLEFLRLSHCYFLTFFPFTKGRPIFLKMLHIEGCKGVESLEEVIVKPLESLTIGGCENLGSLPECLQRLSNLTHLKIWNCPTLEIEEIPFPSHHLVVAYTLELSEDKVTTKSVAPS